MKHIRALAEDFSAKIIGLCPYERRLDDVHSVITKVYP